MLRLGVFRLWVFALNGYTEAMLEWLWIKLIVVAVVAFVYNFWKGLVSPPPPAEPPDTSTAERLNHRRGER